MKNPYNFDMFTKCLIVASDHYVHGYVAKVYTVDIITTVHNV